MFRRRKKLSVWEKLRNSIWPQGGWKRYSQYLMMRLHRLKGTPQSIAAGIACGVAISFTPFVGFHFVLAAITAFLLRGNILASALGTAAGNPLFGYPFFIRDAKCWALNMPHQPRSIFCAFLKRECMR